MDPQLLMPSPAADFNFDSTSTSPYATAPSSPNILFPKFFYATPTNQKNEDLEEADHMDFAFDFSGQLEWPSISDADELFDGGKIKPLELTPSPYSPNEIHRQINMPSKISLIATELFTESENSIPKSDEKINLNHLQGEFQTPRGRERTATTTMRHKVSRSLSPQAQNVPTSGAGAQSQSSQFGFTWYNKWNLKNLLLFRSTSEGSATTSDEQSKKYAMVTKGDEDGKNLSFRSVDGGGSVGGSSRRMKRKVSAHEMHYTANRAVAEEMRRKTLLPYKSGLLGCLGFSHDLREVSRRR